MDRQIKPLPLGWTKVDGIQAVPDNQKVYIAYSRIKANGESYPLVPMAKVYGREVDWNYQRSDRCLLWAKAPD